METIDREFTNIIRGDFRPDLGGWQYSDIKNEMIPYTAYKYYRYIGAGNFRRLQQTFNLENMFSSSVVIKK
jgi:hypothetical protein